MEQIPFDDPQDAEIADNVLQHLRHSLQLLASPAQAQLSHFPAGWVVWMAQRDSPPAREEQGMLIDNGSTFIKSGLPT